MPDLTTLAAVKNFLSLDVNKTGNDAVLNDLIANTSADFLRAIERPDFLTANYTEVRQGDGGQRLPLYHWPITAISAVTVAGTGMPPSPDRMQPGYYIDTDLDPERRNVLWAAGTAAFTDAAVISVAYSGGYVMTPNDVAQAVIDWVAARFRGRDGIQVASQRDPAGDHVAYDKPGAWPDSVERVVQKYKRCWPNTDRRNEDRDYRVTRITKVQTRTEKVES